MNGIINIYKEKGYTSHDVVAKLRGITRQKRIGHTGTLDPDAVGVLPVCIGHATKLCDLLTDKDKTYETVLLLGVETDTQDITGTILAEQKPQVSTEEITKVIHSFIGELEQIPPMYSALKVGGKKLYELAREGKVVERKPRPITIHSIAIKKIESFERTIEVTMEVSCSKGTYIRTLCHDIGQVVGCGGCMKELTRTKVSRFLIEDALTLSQVSELKEKGMLEDSLLSVPDMFPEYKQLYVTEQGHRFLMNGNPLKVEYFKNQEDIKHTKGLIYLVYDKEDRFCAMYQLEEEKLLKPYKMFLS